MQKKPWYKRLWKRILYSRLVLRPKNEVDFWDYHYRHNGVSGPGSVGDCRSFKRTFINRYVNLIDVKCLDVGCGDLSFWENHLPLNYVGIDVSPTVIKKNERDFEDRMFMCVDASENLDVDGDVVLCLDILFHIMSEEKFVKILKNLSTWSNDLLFIYTWYENPLQKVTDGRFQYYRNLSEYMTYFTNHILIGTHTFDDYGRLYVFRNKEVMACKR